jgi:hypothetical protein
MAYRPPSPAKCANVVLEYDHLEEKAYVADDPEIVRQRGPGPGVL